MKIGIVSSVWRHLVIWVLFAGVLPSTVFAQTVLSNEYVEVSGLTNETVEIYGKSELHITGSGTPISGCTIDMHSVDAWVFLPEVKPSDAAGLLGQFRVDGAGAALGSNVRVVQHGQGAVIIPHPADFAPLTVYEGENFSGESMGLTPYTQYDTETLGRMAGRFSSLILKRGYTATFAANPDGSGLSRNIVAAEGDLEIGAVSDWMNNGVNFVRVFPWRWTGKKGSCDVSPTALNADWHYNWSISKTSTLDWEYAGIRQTRYWPSLTQDWDYRGINHLSGFNEPGNSVEDAYESLNNGSVSTAVSAWSDLLATGLRVGSPANTDGGRSWLYSFIDGCDAAGKRVDYVAIHYYVGISDNYWTQGAVDQLYNFLKAVYDEVKRPIWLTEFNNGANWSTTPDPTTGQNKTIIEAMINMMDETPWIERYAIYSNVEWTRDTHYDDGALTPMGQMYKDHKAPIGYVQAVKKHRSSVASYYFDGDCSDASGCGNNGMPVNVPEFAEGKHGQALVLDGTRNYVHLPGDIASSSSFSFAAWVYWDGGADSQRIFDFGCYDKTQYMVLTPAKDGGLAFGLRNGGGTSWVTTSSELTSGVWKHVAVTVSGSTVKIYVDGVLQTTSGSISGVSALSDTEYNYLGKSQWKSDPFFSGKLDDVHIANYTMSQTDIAGMVNNTMRMQLSTHVVDGGSASHGVAYSGSVAGTATDADASAISYFKVYGPDWLTIDSDGTLSGTPADVEGPQIFTVRAHDSEGERRYFTLVIDLPYIYGDGTWSSDSDGVWSQTTKWIDNLPANGEGFSADFSTLNITADRTVTVDGSHTLGALEFGDITGSKAWTLAAGGGVLTLDAGDSSTPVIAVEKGSATIEAPLAGSDGLAKSGLGTLVLASASSLSGTLDIDEGLTSGSGGAVCAAYPSALAYFDRIRIRNSAAADSALQLNGALNGDITSPAAIELAGRNSMVAAIQNLSGDNRLAGGVTTYAGGPFYRIQSDAGTLELGGAISSENDGAAYSWFIQGDGDTQVSGVVQNGSAATVNIYKLGDGRLLLDSKNTYSGTTTVAGGELVVNGTTGAGATTVANGCVLSGDGTVYSSLTAQSGSTVRIGRSGFPLKPNTSFMLIDDFEGYPVGQIGATPNTTGNIWTGVFDGTSFTRIVDILEDLSLAVYGIPSQSGSPWRGVLTDLQNGRPEDFSLPNGEKGTYFFRVRRNGDDAIDAVFGLTDQSASSSPPQDDLSSPYNEYAVQLQLLSTDGVSTLNARDGTGGYLNIQTGISNEWVNVWLVVDNDAHTFRVASSIGAEDGVDYGHTFDFGHRTDAIVGTNALITFGMHASKADELQLDDMYFSEGVNLINPLYVTAFAPKDATLSVEDSFTLAEGAALAFDVSSSNLYDRLVVGGAFNAYGTLQVTLDPAQLAPWPGDSFDLFDAAGGTVSFASVELPALTDGLSWDISGISNGVLSVTGTPSGFDAYMRAHGILGELFDGDANSNGIVNGMEYYLGFNPTNPLPPSPVLWWTNGYLAVAHPFNSSATGMTGRVEWTTDLMGGVWTNRGVSCTTNQQLDEIRADLGDSATNGQLFIRLNVEP